jgi:hypothetical protein
MPRLLACVLAACLTVGLSACSSLSPQVRANAVDYSTVMEDFSNQVLIANVLRARDQSPLNFSDLPLIHGSIASQASLSASAVLQGVAGTNARSELTPGLQFSSSPTFDTSSLNTEAFTLNMLQPVSPVFIESMWHAGISSQLLLNLFVESIRLPSANGEGRVFYNNPDAAEVADYQAFVQLVQALVGAGSDLRSFTVLDPIGLPLLSEAGSIGGQSFIAASQVSTDLYTAMTKLDPAHYQVGSVSRKGTLRGKDAEMAGFQLYRRNASQIGLCIDPGRLKVQARRMRLQAGDASPTSDAALVSVADMLDTAADDLQGFAGSARHPAAALYGGQSGGRGDAQAPVPDAHVAPARGGARGGTRGGGTSNSAMATAVQVYRTTGILDKGSECATQEHISALRAEDDFEKDATRLGYIRWRSAVDVYNYIGALVRNQGVAARTPAWREIGNGTPHSVFELRAGSVAALPGQVSAGIQYRGGTYTVIGRVGANGAGPEVHSFQVLSLLSQLVSIAKLSSDIPLTRSFEVLP